jgi:hypothetical protein
LFALLKGIINLYRNLEYKKINFMKTNTLKSIGLAAIVALSLASCAETPSEVVKGCMDANAVNYNAQATQDVGGCVMIQEKQYSLFYKYTATWCGPCGDWGAPAFEAAVAGNPGKILAFTVQTNDDFSWSGNDDVFNAFSAKWPYGGTPNFQCNNVALGTNVGGMYAEVATNNALTPTAGIGIHYSIGAGNNAGKLNINVYTKFFSAVSGEYFAGVYILHKEIVKNQNVNGTYDPAFVHHHVMMHHVTSVFGDPIASGTIGAGKVYNLGFVFPYTDIPGLDLSKMEVVGILWKKNGANFDLVNVTPNV